MSEEDLNKLEEMRKKSLVLPKTFKVQGKKIRVPELRPPMTPVFNSGKVIAFSPKFFTPSNNVHADLKEFSSFDDSFIKVTPTNERSLYHSSIDLLKP